MEINVIAVGLVMGLAFAAPPGVVTAETLRRGVRGGFPVAMGVQLGSLIGDAAYALLALAGLAVFADNGAVKIGLGGIGGAFLIYLAWSACSGAAAPQLVTTGSCVGDQRGAFLTGMALSVTNPWAIAFWLSLGGVLGALGPVDVSPFHTTVFFASFMIGSAAWALVLSFTIARVRNWIGPRLFRYISIVCGISLGLFAITALSRVLASALGI